MRGLFERQRVDDFETAEMRLETPDSVGFKEGMTSTGVIGRKLGKIYTPPADSPKAIHDLAHVIDRELGRAR